MGGRGTTRSTVMVGAVKPSTFRRSCGGGVGGEIGGGEGGGGGGDTAARVQGTEELKWLQVVSADR
jgi:hypothetical protein